MTLEPLRPSHGPEPAGKKGAANWLFILRFDYLCGARPSSFPWIFIVFPYQNADSSLYRFINEQNRFLLHLTPSQIIVWYSYFSFSLFYYIQEDVLLLCFLSETMFPQLTVSDS